MKVIFPPEAHSGEWGLTYWLTDLEDLTATVELALGPGSGFPDAVTVLTGLFIDGVLTPVQTAGGSLAVVTSDLTVGSTTAFSFLLDHASIQDGAHSVALVGWVNDGKPWAGWAFTVIKNQFGFVPVADQGEASPGSSPIGVYDGTTNVPIFGVYAPPASGSGGFRAVLGPAFRDCPDATVNVGLIAIMDGGQVLLSGMPWKTVQATANALKVVRLEVGGLPFGDGRSHYLTFWAIPGVGQYAEVPLGQRALWWDTAYRIGVAVWGP